MAASALKAVSKHCRCERFELTKSSRNLACSEVKELFSLDCSERSIFFCRFHFDAEDQTMRVGFFCSATRMFLAFVGAILHLCSLQLDACPSVFPHKRRWRLMDWFEGLL